MRTPEDIETDADGLIRLGTVASVDLAAARCTVEIDDDAVTPPLRWIELRMGKTRTWSPPSIGEQVVVLCPAGEIAAGVVLRGMMSDANPAPGNSLRELIRFDDGAEIAYDPQSHQLAAVLPSGATMTVVADGGITIIGDVTLTGNVTMSGTLSAGEDVLAAGVSLKNHKHGGVQAGGAQTGTPE